MIQLTEMIKIADIHEKRIIDAHSKLKKIFPVAAETVNDLSEENFLLIELLTNRFAKLQDFLGSKLINAFLELQGESITGMTVIDKINRMEALKLIPDASIWLRMREVRNHLAHEYPDHPEMTAKYLNQVFLLVPELLKFFQSIKNKINNRLKF